MLIFSLSLKSLNLFASQKFNTDPVEYDTGVTSLMNAVAAADYKAIEFFIKIDPLQIDKQNIGGASALHLAVRNNDPIATKTLIDHRANPNIQDLEGYSPAMRACFYGYNDIFKIIKKNSSINFTLLNNQQDGFIILSALAKNGQCLEAALENIIPMRDLTVDDLKDRLNRAFIISLAKEDLNSKAILLKYLNKLHRFQKKIIEVESRQYQQAQELKRIPRMDTPKDLDAIEFKLTKPNKNNRRKRSYDKNYRLSYGYSGLKLEDKNPKPRKKYVIKKPKVKKVKYKFNGKKKPDKKIVIKKPKKIIKRPVKKDTISKKPIIEKSRIVELDLKEPNAPVKKPKEGELIIDESIM